MEPSVTNHNWSDLFGMVMVLAAFRLSLAELKLLRADSESEIFSVEGRPADIDSRGAITRLQPSITLLRAL